MINSVSKSKQYKISIITPMKNSELFLERCLRSLFTQNFAYIQYIFIDDASTDNSLVVLNKMIGLYKSKKEDCIIITPQKNRGISYCRRLGIKISSGEYIAFCDSDDYVEPDSYEILYKKAIQNNADIITFGYHIEKEKSTKTIFKSYGRSDDILKDIYGKAEIALWDKLFKRDLLMDNDILPIPGLNYYEDCYMTIKAIYFAKKIETIHTPLYHYVDHSNSSSKKNTLENLRSMKHYIEKLEIFFKTQKIDPKIYKTLINRLKFQYKLKLKHINKEITKKDWYHIFPETNLQIMKFLDIPFLGRLKLFCLINLGIF